MASLTRISTAVSSTLRAAAPPPDEAVSLKVPVSALHGALDSGLRKGTFLSRHSPIKRSRRVSVEAAEGGTSDSIFFAPEAPNVDTSSVRATPTQFVKINPGDHADVVRLGDEFEVSFVGMSITPHDMFGNNDLLLCSFTRDERLDFFSMDDAAPTSSKSSPISRVSDDGEPDPGAPSSQEQQERLRAKRTLDNLPSTLRVNPDDVPFIHYDPVIDGHDVGERPDTFVPIPGTKTLYKQRCAANDTGMDKSPAVFVRFSVMEVDKLSDEQLSAIRSIEKIALSVGKASASIPYLKIVSWMLKFANFLGRSALKKVSTPDHVMSKDFEFKIANQVDDAEDKVEGGSVSIAHDEYGNYLRYGYYFFLNQKVDAKLYVQTGSSSNAVPLLLRRYRYNPRFAKVNEKEYFSLTGISYVVIKVTRGTTPVHADRKELMELHRKRLARLLAKYKTEEEKVVEKEQV